METDRELLAIHLVLSEINILFSEGMIWRDKPLYISKNAAIAYSEKTGAKFEDVFPLMLLIINCIIETD